MDVTAEVQFDGSVAVKLQGGEEWELNIYASPADFAKLRDIRHATWTGRSHAIGTCAGAPVWWNDLDGQMAILIGHDDVTWDVAIMVPLATADDIVRAVEEELQPE